MMTKGKRAFLGLTLVALLAGTAWPAGLTRPPVILGGKPKTQKKTHNVGNMWLTVSNFGFFGADDDYTMPSCEFPAHSGTEYLFWGGLWFGALRNKPGQPGQQDTLFSYGVEGWAAAQQYQLWPGRDDADTIIERSIRPGTPHYADSTSPYGKAISEQDYLSAYTDTFTDPAYVGPDHKPLGLKIFQRSYQWSYSYAQDFILIDYQIVNIGKDTLRDFYMGLYIDADCGASGQANRNKALDDVCGFRPWRAQVQSSDTLWPSSPDVDSVVFYRGRGVPPEHVEGKPKTQAPSDKINVAWIADGSGRSGPNSWPTPCVTGTRVLRSPNPLLKYSFQWWYSSQTPADDWGPHDPGNPLDPKGTPNLIGEKYRMMSLSKWDPAYAFDPDQLDPQNGTFAKPGDTRYLLSFGPVYPGWRDPTGQDTSKQYFAPGDTVPITIGYCGGEAFHKKIGIPPGPPYTDYYDFSNLALNASWAYRVYDNPGIDTDGDGYRGTYAVTYKGTKVDTTWLEGDGVPDFRGPPPPNPPNTKLIPSNNKVTVIWDAFPEDPKQIDPFSRVNDFEGYKLYRSYTTDKQEIGGWTLLGQWDEPLSMHDTTIAYQYGYDVWPPPSISSGLQSKYPDYNYPGHNYCYMYEDNGVINGFPLYYAVTAVDFGYKPNKVEPLESSQNASLIRVIPGTSVDESQNLNVMVVPNPYRIDQDYNAMGWENPDRKTWSEHTRRLDFINLPAKCVIRIYTLGGDLVATIFHPTGDSYSTPTSERWNLISRDLQAVTSGVYLFSIAGTDGKVKQVGKFAVIK